METNKTPALSLMYVTACDQVMCSKCADKRLAPGTPVVAYRSEPGMECSVCGAVVR